MSISFILSALGFAVTFVLLFYLAAKYREAAAEGEGVFEAASSAPQAAAPETEKPQSVAAAVKRASLGGPYAAMSVEIEDLKEKIKEAHYRSEELRLLSENRATEILKAVAKLETRLNAFENEYVQKLQPTLMSLIEDLGKLKKE